MRRANKDAVAFADRYSYEKVSDRRKIADHLRSEQDSVCAYTEKILDSTSPGQIEHFDPTLKGTPNDGYTNWFLVHGYWNQKKGDARRFAKYNPLLHPTAEDFEVRIIVDTEKFFYYAAEQTDAEAKNTIEFLHLNDSKLMQERRKYGRRIKDLLGRGAPKDTIEDLLDEIGLDKEFLRVIQELLA